MATTTNFGWETPDDTDLVKDGALAIRTLGNSIDTSLVDLKGGTTGQVLSKTSNTDMDFTWVTSDDANAIQNAIVDAKGDLISATAADTPARLAVGTNGQVLTADSTTATGLKWSAPSTGALTFIKRSTFTTAANTGTSFDNVFTSTYKVYQVVIESLHGSTGSADLYFQWRSGGVTDNTGYNGYLMGATTTWANTNWNNGAQATIALSLGGAANEGTSAVFWCSHVKSGGNDYSQLFGFSNDTAPGFNVFGGYAGLQDNDGFILSPSTGTFTGTVAIYGLATS